jgi:endothelin-converting enzyme/putative endopeptidase
LIHFLAPTLLLAASAMAPEAPAPAATPPSAPRAEAPAPGPKRPLEKLPYTPGLDLSAMDRSVDPCVDFFAYTCGGWIRRNPIPPDKAAWSVFAKLGEENERFLWGILEEAARLPDAERTPAQRRVGDYFAACMDEARVEAAGVRPLAKDLLAISALRSKKELAALLGRIDPTLAGGLAFGFGSEQDYGNTDQVIGVLAAGGLGLPDRDYYVNDDARSKEARERYVEHLGRLLALLGDTPARAAEGARTAMAMETALAKASLTRVEKRDPYKIYHRMDVPGLAKLAPSLRWKDYLARQGVPKLALLNVSEPGFVKELDRLVREEPLEAWRSWLRTRVVVLRAPYLSSPFQEESFAFNGAYLHGVKEDEPRWQKCVGWVDRDLGFELGKVFVAKAFPPAAKEAAASLVQNVQKAMAGRIARLDWMGAETKAQARAKLDAMRNKIGYPDRWRDYSRLAVARADFAGTVVRALRFENDRLLAKIGKPVDRGEWGMTPPTVNAYYDQTMNDMNFPAGVLLPPLFDLSLDLAPAYGNTGGTVGHELCHGFDDEGRNFDAKGNLRDWWTKEDAAAFQERARCVADQYAQYTVVDDVKINSKLTLGEDLADLAGLLLAWDAWKLATAGAKLEPRDGLTPEQRFFVGYAQWACGEVRPEALRVRATTDPHSPYWARVNGLVVNLPEFREAFSCKVGQPMAPRAEVCRVW